jgi:intein/homing endonuclease
MPTTLTIDVTAPSFFYMIGRWLGDGWIRKRKERQDLVRICANNNEADRLQVKLNETGLKWHRSKHTQSVQVFDLSANESRFLIRWLQSNFGQYAHLKTLPSWVFGALEMQRWALIEGYHDSDGSETGEGKVSSTSVSRCLAVGMRLLLQSLGVSASISSIPSREARGIANLDKVMHCREAYSVTWNRAVEWEKCHRTDLHIWGPVREVRPGQPTVEVVDITVVDDHSFIADGQVVNNGG